jgi:hypothetical protein
MSDATMQFVTAMKLRELHRQRDRLRDAYQTLADDTQADAGATRLRKLYEGLREIRFAGRPLHPDLANLEVLLFLAEAGTLSTELLALWEQRLEAELAAGRLRAEFVYLFGALLDEWTRERAADAALLEESRRQRAQLLEAVLASPGSNRHEEALGPLFESMGEALEGLGRRLREARAKGLLTPVLDSELALVLHRVSGDIYRPASVRSAARRFWSSEPLRKELADALTLLLAELPSWDWPQEGLTARALWTRNRWRLYLDEDLPTACLLEVLAERWVGILNRLLGGDAGASARRARLEKLIEIDAPKTIIEHERRQLREAEEMLALEYHEEPGIWEEEDAGDDADEEGYRSIYRRRESFQQSLRRLHMGGDYDGEYGGDTNRAVMLVNAEVRLARAAYPEPPLYVVKVDLEDYYASIPHDVLLTLLARLGVASEDVEFFRRFLSPPIRQGGEVARMRRGVPMGHALSGMLAELLMRLLERRVCQEARVRIVRLVDDICILSPSKEAARMALQAIDQFCAECGLQVNREKSGAVCIGGPHPEELPPALPRWGMLELNEAGEWGVHPEAFQAHLEQARTRVSGAARLLSKVQVYTANSRYLSASLSLGAPLGEAHREATTAAVRAFHQEFFGPDEGIVAGLCAALRERFALGSDTPIPEAWIYWPITAGGLGLRNPMITAAQYAAAYRERAAVLPPARRFPGWDRERNEWSALYGDLLEEIEPQEPKETTAMQALVNDFIARGGELSLGQQQRLQPYWRWVLSTYGPQILERFGTFRFLITELVPLQLIGEQHLQDTSLGEVDASIA